MKWKLPLIHHRRKAKSEITLLSQQEAKPKKLSFEDLPYEIRDMIFELCDLDYYLPFYGLQPKNWFSLYRMPNIIIALRPQPMAYHQILALFYKQNTFHLGWENRLSFGPMMSAWAIRSIRRLHLDIADTWCAVGTLNSIPFTPELLASRLGMHAVEDLTLLMAPIRSSRALSMSQEESFIHAFPRWLVCFKHLKSLTVQIPVLAREIGIRNGFITWTTIDGHRERVEAQWSNFRRFDALVGGISEPGNTDTLLFPGSTDESAMVQNFIWVPAQEGGVMDWSKVPIEALQIQSTDENSVMSNVHLNSRPRPPLLHYWWLSQS